MAKSVKIAGASYTDVPAIEVPTTTGGTARYIDEDDVPTFQTYYTGSTAPSSNLGQNGDIYLQK